MQSISLDNRRRTASRILAAAALELFPETLLVQGGDTPLGFYYDFIFPFVFQKEFLTLLEEKMRQICKEERPVQILEMVPKNAAEFLAHHRHEMRAKAAREIPDTLTEVFKMGSFIDLCEGGAGENSHAVGAFKLQKVHNIEGTTRILGTAFSDKQELKTFLKKKAVPGRDHQQLGKDLSLFTKGGKGEQGWIWHPKGESLRELILQIWKEEHVKQNFHIIHSFPTDIPSSHREYHRQTQYHRIAECRYEKFIEKTESLTGLFESTPYCADYAHIFSKSFNTQGNLLGELREDAISSLQFIVKISKIFNFEVDIVQCPSWKRTEDEMLSSILVAAGLDGLQEGLQVNREQRREKSDYPTVEIRTEDILGRKWVISFLKINFKEGVIIRSSFVSLERVIALLLEQSQGNFEDVLKQLQAFNRK